MLKYFVGGAVFALGALIGFQIMDWWMNRDLGPGNTFDIKPDGTNYVTFEMDLGDPSPLRVVPVR